MCNHLQDLREHGVAQRLVQIDCQAMAVVGRQAEADTDAVNLDAPGGVIFFDRILQMVVEVILVVGEIGGAVHGTAVGNYHENAARGIVF